MTGEYLLEGLAVPESLNLLHDLLERVGSEHPDIDAGDLMLFETAVIEVAGNVVEHGRPSGRVSWTFHLSVHSDRLEARLSDSGEEYPGGTWGTSMPKDPMQEDGRGLALATAVLDDLDYERTGDVNHWTMLRRRG
ncbi:ATP-binding protein [Nocardioides sp.]|jgi:serine/threonine-protein kinase RsbW|uniref:ATP-binding protein n=1 Tax=Nocardioides sp. TaxID=35761 RepID=UPI002F3EE8C7